ncbi:hypothetical protein [Paenibacillus eucommiae]|uniref:DUF3784 domain-containing protein n=1 Tax=Paenibacillus eucommiae TaxID=1355755 RepID=A0ABS4IVB3_9BACL|nr:hypothetical protein [Paenibacillus eucommiae]MBP1991515.1 hypothetical protein [Paenibacillus eucommiae]
MRSQIVEERGKKMYAQIFLGIAMIIIGICNLLNLKFVIGKNAKKIISENELISFQKGLALPYFLLGIILITMGLVERENIIKGPVFIGIYIILAAIPLAMALANNKKHSGYYFLW